MTVTSELCADLTILDLSEGIAGGYCTKLFAAMGARVLKVEPPAGDALRRMGPFAGDLPHPERGLPFLYLGTGKQSITLNLDTADGLALLLRLAGQADVLVETAGPGVLTGLGLGYDVLHARYPELIVAALTAFGQDGPYRDWQTSELVAEALSGLMYSIGDTDREPLKIGGSPALYTAGIAMFSAIMAAVWQRDLSGEGQFIDLSLHEITTLTQIHGSVQAAFHGAYTVRRGSPYLQAADGWVSLGLEMGVGDDTWGKVCALLDRPDLEHDPRFATTIARREHREALNDVLGIWVATKPKEDIYHQLQALRSIAGHVATTADLFLTQQLQQRGYFATVDHPEAGAAAYPGLPFRFGESLAATTRAPRLGEHNTQVYCHDLGLTTDELVRLRERGAV